MSESRRHPNVAIAAPAGASFKERWVASWFPADAAVGCFHGEDTGE